MNNITGFIVFVLIASCSTYGQEKIESSAPNFGRYFYGIPIDSCFEYIAQQSIDGVKLVKISSSGSADIPIPKSIKYRVLNPKTVLEADSIQIDIDHFTVAIGGSQKMESPIDYEHCAVKTFYFSNSVIAYKAFKKLKIELDALEQRFSPLETKRRDGLEIVYPLETGQNENLTTFQIHFSIFREKDLYILELNHRKIYANNECN